MPYDQIKFLLELKGSFLHFFSVSVDDVVKSVDLFDLCLEHVLGLYFLMTQQFELLLQLVLGSIVFVLHGQDVLVDGDFVL